MENNLISEINDVRRIMGMELINEDTLLKNLPLLTEGFVSEILDSVFNATSGHYLATMLTNDEKQLIRDFIKGDIKKIDEKIRFSDFMKTTRGIATIAELKEAVKTAKRDGRLNLLGKTYWDRMLYRMEVAETKWSEVKLKPKKALNKSWSDIKDLTADDVAYLTRNKSLFDKFTYSVINMFQMESKLLTETLELIKQLKNDTGSANVETYRKKISDNLLELTKIKKDNFNNINDWISNNVPVNVQKRLNKKGLTGYQLAEKLANGTAKAEFDKKWGTFKQRRTEFWGGLWDFLLFWRSGGKRIKRRYGEDSPILTKMENFMSKSTKDGYNGGRINFDEFKWDIFIESPMSIRAWKEYIQVFGPKAAFLKYSKEYAYVFFILNSIETLYDWITEVIGSINRNYDNQWLKDKAEAYDKKYYRVYGYKRGSKEDVDDHSNMSNWNVFQNIWDIAGMFLTTLWDNLTRVSNAIPGLLDNAVIYLAKKGAQAQHETPITPEEIEKQKEDVEKGKENVIKLKDSVSSKIKEKIDTIQQTKVNVPIPGITGSEMGFKLFCKTYGFTIKSDFDGITGTTVEYDNTTGNNIWQWKVDTFVPFAKE